MPGEVKMQVYEALLERKTIHEYSSEPLSDAVLERALEAATHAPNHRMTEPWRFTLVGPESRRELTHISADLKQKKAGFRLEPAQLQKLRDKIETPACLVVVSQVLHADPDVEREDYAAVACAIQSFMLALFAEGVGSKWSTGSVTTDPRTYRLLEIPAESQRIVGFVWAGMPLRDTRKPPRRNPLGELIRRRP